MAEKSFGEELAGEVAGKAIIWGPGIAGAILLGPVGILLGAVVSAALLTSCRGPDPSQQRPPSNV
jgi:hypothetical protein